MRVARFIGTAVFDDFTDHLRANETDRSSDQRISASVTGNYSVVKVIILGTICPQRASRWAPTVENRLALVCR